MSASDDVLREFIGRVEVLFDDLNKRVDHLAVESALATESIKETNVGLKLALGKLDGVDESLGAHLTEMQRLRQTIGVLENAMLVLSADLQLTRESVAQQVTHEVDKKLDAHLTLVELAEVAKEATGSER